MCVVWCVFSISVPIHLASTGYGPVLEFKKTQSMSTLKKLRKRMNATNLGSIKLLKRDNYETWKIQMQALLIKNDAWSYVSDECEKLTVVDAAKALKKNDSKAESDIILLMNPGERFRFYDFYLHYSGANGNYTLSCMYLYNIFAFAEVTLMLYVALSKLLYYIFKCS